MGYNRMNVRTVDSIQSKENFHPLNIGGLEIHLGIAFDHNYMRHFYALFASVLAHNRLQHIVVHAIITGLSIDDKEKIKVYAEKNGADILFYEIDESFVKQFVLSSHWSSAVYYRLFFPLIVPEQVTRLIYLDTDIVVVNDLTKLYTIDLGNHPIAAVYDNWVKTAPQLGIAEEGNYFNSGMMLINIPKWKEQKITEKVFAYLTQYPERINYVDQCALNAVLINNWKKLDFRYNVLHSWIPEAMSKKERQRFLKDKYIIHYTLDRPWKMLCRNPLRFLYFKYLGQSPYRPRKKFDDFELNKMPLFLRIKVIDLYYNLPLVKALWRKIKSRFNAMSKNIPLKLF
jgi:lipopolysaccharide biosynthesis glycosyltransferase